MSLYGQGIYRPAVLRTALLVNGLLSSQRNEGVLPEGHLPPDRIVERAETIPKFPAVMKENLRGTAIWYDACIPYWQRQLMDILRWAATTVP
jgi:glycerol-3-phosphate dehydrogenase